MLLKKKIKKIKKRLRSRRKKILKGARIVRTAAKYVVENAEIEVGKDSVTIRTRKTF